MNFDELSVVKNFIDLLAKLSLVVRGGEVEKTRSLPLKIDYFVSKILFILLYIIWKVEKWFAIILFIISKDENRPIYFLSVLDES